MHRQSLPFDTFSILFTLKSCTHLRNLPLIRHLHSHLLKIGFDSHVYVVNSLLHAYVVASLDDARALFDEMPERNTVKWNTMVSGYSKLGDVEKARNVFERMPVRDVASWSALIAGYISDIVFYFCGVTLCSIFVGFARMGSIGLLLGKSVHGFAVKNGWELNAELGTVLVDMYTKCGFLKSASHVFNIMQDMNVVSWTALICGSAQHGYGNETLSIFDMMRQASVRPNE
ncbi:hypothetical protein Vadar_024719 [Vaccinium darrowii]|uniref:Uncharacterized protein n=1 Tax=Vaccinium darrowii TaxID=229202 RepID=A0ACB7YYK2_9ERIC|nr:hypothetical protein Vadar_012880 [Vaccinium darrowii]KAH7858506.1 hypothetical protein Vadar_024719 [Vaccinium darrowii]